MDEIRDALRKFNDDRDWEQFHTPENLAKSISIEAAELLECFQWNSDYDREALCDEIADVMMYCIMLSDKIGADIKEEIFRKMKKNAEKLKMATLETARESERGIVDMETLKATNESLISTLDEVLKIQQEGRQKRKEAEIEMQKMENDLKQKLLQVQG